MCGNEGYVVKSIKFEKGLVKDYLIIETSPVVAYSVFQVFD
jgi:hypothetical protein